jgi:hypothetical protein
VVLDAEGGEDMGRRDGLLVEHMTMEDNRRLPREHLKDQHK